MTLGSALGSPGIIREVETGLAQVAAGQTLSHDAVGERLAKKLAEHDARR